MKKTKENPQAAAPDPVLGFDPNMVNAPTPEDRIRALMDKVTPPKQVMEEPEFAPIKNEPYTPDDMLEIVKTLSLGGYTDLDAANRALRIMFAASNEMLGTFDEVDQVIASVEEGRRALEVERNKADSEAKAVGLALRELCLLILGGDATPEDLVTAATRCKVIADNATAGVEEYEGNMLNIAINLRALNDTKDGPLRGLGRAPREQILYLVNAAAAVLDDARINMLALKDAAQGLMHETTHLRSQLETVNAVADKPEVLN